MKQCNSILIVDDEPLNFDVIEGFLSQEDYALHYVPDGTEAIQSLGTFFNPDLILLDLMMPGLDGVEVCRYLKSTPEWKMVPIIIVTALNSKEELARCLHAGADDFISKPVHRMELVARVHAMLRLKKHYDEVQKLSHLQQETIQFLEQSLSQLHGNLGSTLSHEMNTPLHGIMTSFSLLQRDLEQTGASQNSLEILEVGLYSARRLEALHNKFLSYLHLESLSRCLHGQTPPDPASPLNWTVTAEAIEIAHTKANQFDRGPDLAISIDDVLVAVNSRHFYLLLGEVFDNAFKFSAAQTPIQITGVAQSSRFRLEVRDRGRGMTQEQIQSIGAFVQFERIHYEQQGMGLGLSIAQKVVDLYGGSLSISSVYQQETAVILELPLVPEVSTDESWDDEIDREP